MFEYERLYRILSVFYPYHTCNTKCNKFSIRVGGYVTYSLEKKHLDGLGQVSFCQEGLPHNINLFLHIYLTTYP